MAAPCPRKSPPMSIPAPSMRWLAPETARRPPELRKRPLPALMDTPAEPLSVRELKTEPPAKAVAFALRMELAPNNR